MTDRWLCRLTDLHRCCPDSRFSHHTAICRAGKFYAERQDSDNIRLRTAHELERRQQRTTTQMRFARVVGLDDAKCKSQIPLRYSWFGAGS